MKPYLNILGRKHNIVAVEVELENGDTKFFHDKDSREFMKEEEKADFSTAIELPDKYQHLVNRIEKTIDESVEYLTDLKLQLADEILESRELPFPDVNCKHLIEEISAQVSFVEGLELALEEMKKVEQPSVVDDEEEEVDPRWLAKTIYLDQN